MRNRSPVIGWCLLGAWSDLWSASVGLALQQRAICRDAIFDKPLPRAASPVHLIVGIDVFDLSSKRCHCRKPCRTYRHTFRHLFYCRFYWFFSFYLFTGPPKVYQKCAQKLCRSCSQAAPWEKTHSPSTLTAPRNSTGWIRTIMHHHQSPLSVSTKLYWLPTSIVEYNAFLVQI